MSGLIGGRKSKRSEWDQETAFLVDCGTSPTERDSVDWPWTGEEATTQGWLGRVRAALDSLPSYLLEMAQRTKQDGGTE